MHTGRIRHAVIAFLGVSLGFLFVACESVTQDTLVVSLQPQPRPGRISGGLAEFGPAGDPLGGQTDLSGEVLTGIPDTLADLHVRFVDFQWSYLLLEAFENGRLDSTKYHNYRDPMQVVTLPGEPFDQHVHYAIGRKPDGDFLVVFDTDNDEDLADEPGVVFPWEGPRLDRMEFLARAKSYIEHMGSLAQVTVAVDMTDGDEVFVTEVTLTVAPHLKAVYNVGQDGEVLEFPSFFMGAYQNMVGLAETGGAAFTFWAGAHRLGTYPTRDTQISFEPGDQRAAPIDSTQPLAMNPYLIGQVINLGGTYYRLDHITMDGSELRLVRVESMPGVGIRPGMEAPEFRAVTIDGNAIKLSDYRGRFVLIDFWSTSCGPCIQDLPDTIALYDRFEREDFEIVGIPAYFLLDPDGKVVDPAVGIRPPMLAGALDRLIDEWDPERRP